MWRPLLASHRQSGTRRGRGAGAGAGAARLHAADGAGDRDRHEDRRHPADHLAADHPGGDRPPASRDRPEIMAVLASLLGAVAVAGGLFGSLQYDTPSGPSIVVAALVLFLVQSAAVSARARPQRLSLRRNPEGATDDGPAADPQPVAGARCAVSQAEAPLSAYTILDQLRDDGFRAPLQVYRALDKLLEHRPRAPAGKPQRLRRLRPPARGLLHARAHRLYDLRALRPGHRVPRPRDRGAPAAPLPAIAASRRARRRSRSAATAPAAPDDPVRAGVPELEASARPDQSIRRNSALKRCQLRT